MAYNIEILFLTLNSGIYSLLKSLKEHLEEKKLLHRKYILDTTCENLPFYSCLYLFLLFFLIYLDCLSSEQK